MRLFKDYTVKEYDLRRQSMDCYNVKVNEKDQFISKYTNHDQDLIQFYQFDPNKDESFKTRMAQPSNGREQQLMQIIRQYMSDLSLSEAQHQSLEYLAKGAKVVIGGQQAGILTGPLYTFHKILSIIVASTQLTQKYQQPVIPVFWIAGEDHDFDEVNHTYAYNEEKGALEKVKYHTLTPPEMSVSQFEPDKATLKTMINHFFSQLPETLYTKTLLNDLERMIEQSTHWTDLFKQIVHRCFRDHGLLLIDAHFPLLRQMEKSFLKSLFEQHLEIDKAFRQGQSATQKNGVSQMIETDSNVHLFVEMGGQRQLLKYKRGVYHLSKSGDNLTFEEVMNFIEHTPEKCSNNVVTRPLMQEWLFNTVAFVGGPSEIKYWAELHEVFQRVQIDMPIVLPRMRMTYLTPKANKLLQQYQLDISEVIAQGAEKAKEQFVRAKASDQVIEEIEKMVRLQEEFYERLEQEMSETEDNRKLLSKNHKIQLNQYRYLQQRYLTNIEKENKISMRHFNQLTSVLHPMGGLQERVLNPFQFLNLFGWDMYQSSTFPPLVYTFEQLVVEI